MTATEHIIHDLAYDYHGRRVAVCSSDQSIKIYDDGHKSAEWKAHAGSIWRLAWAHPEFGQVLASCSFDRKICIWEERADTEEPTRASNGAWRLVRELADARDSLNHVAFAPKQRGLLLASCAADRRVRVHEAPDVMDLSSWGLLAEFDAEGSSGGRAATAPQCLAWNPSPTEPLMLAVGMSDGSVVLWRQPDGGGNWARLLAFDAAPGGVGVGRPQLAHVDRVHDLAWAADMGRSYHLVASASRDRTVKVWSLRRLESLSAAEADRWQARCDAELPHHSQVWRVAWNACGSLLASSVDDGSMHVYRMDAPHSWEQVSFIEPADARSGAKLELPAAPLGA